MIKKIPLLSLLLFISTIGSIQSQSSDSEHVFGDSSHSIDWNSLGDAVPDLKESDKIVLVSIVSDHCPYCKKMDRQVFPERKISETISEYFIPVQVNINSRDGIVLGGKTVTVQSLLKQWDVMGTPTTLFLNDRLNVIAFQPGYLDVDTYYKLLHFVGSGAYATRDFSDYQPDHDHD